MREVLTLLPRSPAFSHFDCAAIDTLLVHLDDADGAIQAAVFGALVPYCRLAPTHARKAVAAARDAHRHPGHCNRLLEIIAGSAAK